MDVPHSVHNVFRDVFRDVPRHLGTSAEHGATLDRFSVSSTLYPASFSVTSSKMRNSIWDVPHAVHNVFRDVPRHIGTSLDHGATLDRFSVPSTLYPASFSVISSKMRNSIFPPFLPTSTHAATWDHFRNLFFCYEVKI